MQKRSLSDFLNTCVTPFHVVEEMKRNLSSCGFKELKEDADWSLVSGGAYYTVRSSSSIIAFRIPTDAPRSFQMAAAHSDSPCFKIKNAVENDDYTRLRVEKYGSVNLPTWFDRPLSLGGRVFASQNGKIYEKLIRSDKKIVIPSVATHYKTEMEMNLAVDLLPLLGDGNDASAFTADVEAAAGAPFATILGKDLYLYSASEAFVWGDGKYITSPRLDDLQCVYALLHALTAAENTDAIPLLAVFHNEEVGSKTAQGADSDFLMQTLMRICSALGLGASEYARMLASSFMVSADNAHAVHPNHPELADAEGGRCYMNHGIVIKNTASERYATDGFSDALFGSLCQREDIPCQHYYNRADMNGGSTLGNLSCAHVSVHTVDIGLAQLSMHSAVETAGVEDTDFLEKLMTAYFSTRLLREENAFCWKQAEK